MQCQVRILDLGFRIFFQITYLSYMEQAATPTAWVELPASGRDPARRFVFDRPLSVWQADTLPEVKPALERVTQEQQAGHYVVGFLSYESAPAFDAAMITPPPGPLPYAWFASFDGQSPSVYGGAKGGDSSFKFQVSSFPTSSLIPHLSSLTSRDEYVAAVQAALSHIRAGDIYQVNYTIRASISPGFSGGTKGGESDLDFGFSSFLSLLAAAPMPHAAYIDTGEARLVSLSPELFLRKRGRLLESRPMKGTAKREPSWAADETARRALSQDEKNRAENVMIVDLVRNDLGRVCKMGSVAVPELWRVDRFPTVHQMTSLVRGELRDEVSLFDIFAALFPPGSVTGAPKIRAMQIIAELEPAPRGIYCGTIGLFFPNGDFECNVAIRTIQTYCHSGHRASLRSAGVQNPDDRSEDQQPGLSLLGLGSGVVADSDPETEWQETQLKGDFVTLQPRDFLIYETIRYDRSPSVHGGARGGDSSFKFQVSSFLDLHLHLRRLRQSALYFNRPFPLREIIHHLRKLQLTLGEAPARIKLNLSVSPPFTEGREGVDSSFKFQVSSFPVSSLIETQVIREFLLWPDGGMTLMLSDLRLDPEDFRLYHKTNLRPEKYVELEKARALGGTEVLFLNTRGELCEGALSNIALKIDRQWLTPKLSCGLLPGTYREKQLASGRWHEAILTLDDLKRAEEIRMGNAVRGEGMVLMLLDSQGRDLLK